MNRGSNGQQPLTSPDTDNPHAPGIASIHDSERRMDEFTQKGLIELGHDASHIRVVRQRLDALQHLLHQSRPDVRHPLLQIPALHFLEIA